MHNIGRMKIHENPEILEEAIERFYEKEEIVYINRVLFL